MNTEDVLEEFRASGALREGHFVLSSGLHSGTFLQKNLVFQYPERTARLCKALAEKIKEKVGRSPRIEGLPAADWVLIDADDVIVHLFRPEVRTFYNIEKIWSVDSGHRVDSLK